MTYDDPTPTGLFKARKNVHAGAQFVVTDFTRARYNRRNRRQLQQMRAPFEIGLSVARSF